MRRWWPILPFAGLALLSGWNTPGQPDSHPQVVEPRPVTQQPLASQQPFQFQRSDAARMMSECRLFKPGAERAPAQECIGCHREADSGGRHTSHPVDIDYQGSRSYAEGSLRPVDEAVRRGVMIPDGKIRCGSCHDPRSPWKHHLALPPGAPVRRAVNPGDPRTYDDALHQATPDWAAMPQSERDVSPKPLCLSCHGFD